MSKIFGIIYKTTCLVNGKIYIGQTTHWQDKSYLGSGVKIEAAIRRFGRENFKRCCLKICYGKRELDIWEYVFIKKYKSQDKKIGYNIADGEITNRGKLNPASLPEVREKMKRSALKRIERGQFNHKDCFHSEEAKLKMSKVRQSRYSSLSEEWKAKIRKSCEGINKGAVRSEDMKNRLSRLKKGGRFINNGIIEKFINKDVKQLPDGWSFGRLKRKSNDRYKDLDFNQNRN